MTSATKTDRSACWQEVQSRRQTACGCVRDGWYVLGSGGEQLARYPAADGITAAYQALERYRKERDALTQQFNDPLTQ